MTPTKYPRYYVEGAYVYRKNANGSFKRMSSYVDNVGYYQLKLRVDKRIRCIRVHRIIAETLIPNPDNLPQVNHIDGNKLNNDPTNLEWCTNRENTQAAYDNGQYPKHRCVRVKITDTTTGKATEYKSIREASSILGINRKTLSAYVNGTKQCDKFRIEVI